MPITVPRRRRASRDRRSSIERRVLPFAAVVALVAVVSGLLTTFLPVAPAEARYASGGTGAHRGSIDWFEWGTAGTAIANGTSRTNTRTIGGQTLATTCTITGLTGQIRATRPGSFQGDGLDDLYNIGGTGTNNQLISGIANTVAGAAPTFTFSCAVTLDGAPVPLQGLVMADAETSTSENGSTEYVQARPLQTATWRIIDRYRAPANCTTSTQAILNANGTLRLAPNGAWCAAGAGPMAVAFMEGATSAAVTLQGGGVSAIALGVVLGSDFGDAPASYGAAGGLIAPAWTGGTVPVGTTAVSNSTFTLGTQGQPALRLGARTTSEGAPLYSANASGDGTSDDGVVPTPITANPGGTYTLPTTSCTGTGYVAGWIDWNGNGRFDAAERSGVVPCANGTAALSWTVPADAVPSNGTFLRLRIAADAASAGQATGLMTSGEVEDYQVTLDVPTAGPLVDCTTDGAIFNTGYNAATGGTLPDNAKDANWDVIGPFGTGAYPLQMPPAGQTWASANVGNIVPTAWAASPYGNAQWISQQTMASPNSPTGDWYYRYAFVLDPDVSPEALELDLSFYADNNVAEVFVNGVPQSGKTTGLPQAPAGTNPYQYAGFQLQNGAETSLGDDWRTGANEIIVQLKSGQPMEGFLAQFRPSAICPLPALDIEKTSTATMDSRSGDTVTYTVTATNTGDGDFTESAPAYLADNLAGVLDDGAYSGDATAMVAGSVAGDLSYAEPTITWTGPLASGEAVTISYTVTLGDRDGDGEMRNVAWAPSSPPGEQLTPPACDPATAEGVDPETGEPCAVVEVELPALSIGKSSSSSELPAVGETLTYTVRVTNAGPGDYRAGAPASFSDDLSEVIDDATFESASMTATIDGEAIAGPTYAAPMLSWSGALAAGQTAVFTYTVTYAGAGDRMLTNSACVPDSEAIGAPCDSVAVPGASLTQRKDAVPSSSPLAPGSAIAYTLSFDNDGEAAATVDTFDELTAVLDDADVTGTISSSAGLTAVRDGNRILITGSVPAGTIGTVTYTVTIRPDGERGDNRALNFLGRDVPEELECVPADPDAPDCTINEIPQMSYTKSVVASADPIVPGTTLEYTVTVTNSGAAAGTVSRSDNLVGVLDDATLTTVPVVSGDGAVTASPVVDGIFSLSGTLGAGGTATVTYAVTVNEEDARGDNRAVNFLVNDRSEEPPTECAPGSTDCTVTDLPHVTSSKSVDPASGTSVDAGDVLTYTLTFTNDGLAVGPVDFTDYLARVLDDAAVTMSPVASDDALSPVLGTDSLVVTGSLEAGQTVTVTYAVTVSPDGSRGDNHLGNFLRETDDVPPTVDEECASDDPNCTSNPVGEIDSWKTVEASESPVAEGTVLTYTLHVENIGAGTGTVSEVDDLTHVVDDADVTTEPSSAVLTVVRDGARIAVTGSLGAGASTTITYSVTVRADGERGDDIAANFLLKPVDGEVPPVPEEPVCQPTDAERPDCTLTPIGRLLVSKSVEASSDPIVPGTTLTYTITFDNQGQGPVSVDKSDNLAGVLDDATLTTNPAVSDDALSVSDVEQGVFTVTGELAAGQVETVTYAVTVNEEDERGDDRATNFLVDDPSVPPPATCEPGNLECTSTDLPNVTSSKSVDPASGTSVDAGDVLTYTLTFTNSGNAVGAVDFTDHLAKVLDDAEVTAQPVASVDTVTPSAVVDQTIVVTGSLLPGQTATVTYSMRVLPDGERGDNRLGNVLVETGEDPPTECVEGSANCTENPAGEIHSWKTVEASETPVAEGTVLTYTLHVENIGQGAGTVEEVDDLTHVVDDADVTTEPSSEVLSVVRDGSRIVVTGSLPAGASTTITYSVTVRPDGERGDDIAANFLLKPVDGEVPPVPEEPVCQPTDAERPDCTLTPIGRLLVSKAVVASADPIVPGTTLTYTLTFENAGAGPVSVDKSDNLTGVLDDATLTTAPVVSADGGLTATPVVDGIFSVTGGLTAGQTTTVTYTVTVNEEDERGDNRAANFVVDDRSTPPPTDCVPGSTECTVTDLPRVTSSKSVDPASGTSVDAGDVLTYTLTFTNDGTAEGPVDFTDHLSRILDDATVTTAPVASDSALSGVLGADSIVVTGSLAAGQTVTVTYAVTVSPDGSRGDNRLGNVLVETGEDPPTECVEGSRNCTENPVGEIDSWKTVEASERPIAEGTVLTYTLHFENIGAGAGTVNEVDDLTHVLDDSDVTTEPSSAVLAVTRDGSRISVTGSLAAGASTTITYSVTVRPDGARGDDIAANFLLKPVDGEVPPVPEEPMCQPTDAERPDCTLTPIGRLLVSKAVEASSDPIVPGTTLTYTITFDNQGQGPVSVDKSDNLTGVLDDATLTALPVASDDALAVSAVDGGVFTVTGELAAGRTETVTYTVTVNAEDERGDNRAANFLVDDPAAPPPATCAPGSLECTSTDLPNVTSSKSVDPASGTTVVEGDEVTYTLTFTNSGNAVGAVDFTDHLANVLDDAAVTAQPISSDAAVTTTAIVDERIAVSGTLVPGQTVTVSYTVTVSPDGQRGDDVLGNYLVRGDAVPPTQCADGDVTCTVNPVPEILDAKSANPASGSPVAAGQTVTYTLSFRNDGAAAGAFARDDVLTGVLDDADLVGEPTVAGDGDGDIAVELVDDRLVVTGSLEPGASATVSYSVVIRPFAEQGDHVLGNVLVRAGEEPPATCEPVEGEDADCTVHPIGEIAATKSVDPASATAVEQGDVLTYTLTFHNTGAGAATVDYVDRMGDVLDDATLTRSAQASVDTLELELSGDVLSIGGRLTAGETATVTYAVTVMAYDRQGNHILGNYLGLSNQTPTGVCPEGSALCTTNPIQSPPSLAITGGTIGFGAIAAGLVVILLGVVLLVVRRRRESAGGVAETDSEDEAL